MAKRKLTTKQKLFCKYFVTQINGKIFNGNQAAIEAGYSKKTARKIASENLTKPDIQVEIQRLMKKTIEKVELSAEDWVKNNQKILKISLQEQPIKEQDPLTQEWIKAGFVLDLNNANKANEQLGRYLQILSNNVKVSGDPDAPLNSSVVVYVPDNGRMIGEKEDEEES